MTLHCSVQVSNGFTGYLFSIKPVANNQNLMNRVLSQYWRLLTVTFGYMSQSPKRLKKKNNPFINKERIATCLQRFINLSNIPNSKQTWGRVGPNPIAVVSDVFVPRVITFSALSISEANFKKEKPLNLKCVVFYHVFHPLPFFRGGFAFAALELPVKGWLEERLHPRVHL